MRRNGISPSSIVSAVLLSLIFVVPSFAQPNQPPVAHPQTLSTANDVDLDLQLTATDPEGDKLTFSANPPQFGTLKKATNKGVVTYTPPAGYLGADTFTFSVSDGNATSTSTITIVVVAPSAPPVGVNDAYTTVTNIPLNVAAPGVLANDTDDGTTLTAVLDSSTNKGTIVLNANGSFTYTPNAGFSGSDSFRYYVHDGGQFSDTRATVSITVRATNAVPVATPQSLTTAEEAGLAITLAGTDGNADPLTFAIVTPPASGTLSGTAPNVIYTPAVDFHGTATFTFTASDGFSTSPPATVTINVTPVNDAPIAVADTFSMLEDAVLTGNVLTNDSDVDSTLTAQLASGPNVGTVSLQANGAFTYTPPANYYGSATFSYTATDGSLTSAATTVSIDVQPVNDAPGFQFVTSAVSVLDTAGSPSFAGTAINISAGPSNESTQTVQFVVASNSNPSLLDGNPSFSPDGTLSLTTRPGTTGTAQVVFYLMDDGTTANGGVNVSPSQTFTILVQQLPAVTSAAAANFQIGQTTTFTVTTDGDPTPAITAGGTLPAGFTFADNGDGTGNLTATPPAGTAGVYGIVFQATNSLTTASQNFTITVTEAVSIVSASATTFVIGSAGGFTISTAGFPQPSIALAGALPAGVTFADNANGSALLSGTPAPGTAGSYPLVFSATNGLTSATQNFTLTVVSPCTPMTLAPSSLPNGTLNAAYGPIAFSASGGTAPYTFSLAGTLPAGLTFSSGTLSGTPSQTGTFPNLVITVTDANACPQSFPYSLTVVGFGVNESYAGIGNTQIAGGGYASPATPFASHASGLLANEPGGSLAAAVVTNAATSAGGTISIAADGSFLYTPPLGLTPADSYTYTFTSNGSTLTATVTFNLTSRVWYAKNDAAPAGNGASSTPFSTLAAAQAAASPGDTIYVMTGDGTTSGQDAGISLAANQKLVGAGVALVVDSIQLAPSGTKPKITSTSANGVVAANGNTIAGLTISGAAHDAVHAPSVNNLTLDSLLLENVAAGRSGVFLYESAGAFTMTNTAVTGSGLGVNVHRGTASVSIDAASSIGGLGLQVMEHSTGNVNIAAAITGSTIRLHQNPSGPITLSGTQTLTSTSDIGLSINLNYMPINLTGALTINATTLSGIQIWDNWGPVHFSGSQNITTTSGNGVMIYWNGSVINFTGSLTSTSASGAAVAVSEDQANVTFGGTMNAASTSHYGFYGWSSGPVSVTGTANISTGAGAATPAVFIAHGLTTGPLGINFTTVNKTGGASGVVLQDLTNASISIAGGTIQNATVAGIDLVNLGTSTVTLGGMTVSGNTGIRGSSFGTLSIAPGMQVSGGGSGGGALNFTNGSVNGTFASVSSTSGVGVSLTNVGGTWGASAGTLSTPGNAFIASGGNASMTWNGDLVTTGNGRVLVVGDHHTGSLTFNGSITKNGGIADGMFLQTAHGNYAFNGAVALTGGAIGIAIDASNGTFAFGSGTSITNPANQVLRVFNGGSPNVTYSGSFVKTNNANNGIDIANAGGTILVNGTGTKQITTSGGGHAVNLTNNSGTIRFTNGNLALQAAAGRALSATGGGTLEVTGAGNTIQATAGGTAVFIDSTTIGAAGVVVKSVSALNPVNGIVLKDTGSTGGGLHVLGDGTPGSGGTIHGSIATGVELVNTRDVVLRSMVISNTVDNAIRGRRVTNFTLQNSTLSNWAMVNLETAAIAFNVEAAGRNLDGVVTITGNTLTGGKQGIDILDHDGTIVNAQISNNTITGNNAGGVGINIRSLSMAATAANITAMTISNNVVRSFGSGIALLCGNENATNATVPVCGASTASRIHIISNDVQGTAASRLSGEGILAKVTGRGTGWLNISGNTAKFGNASALVAMHVFGPGTVTSTIDGNAVEDCPLCQGVSVFVNGFFSNADAPAVTASLHNNNANLTNTGVFATTRSSTGLTKLAVTSNTVTNVVGGGSRPGIRIEGGNLSGGGDTNTCLDIRNNNAAATGTASGIGLRKEGTNFTLHDFNIVGTPAGPNNAAAVSAYVGSQNPNSQVGSFSGQGAFILNGDNFGSCVP
jgi:large repetitive protein